MTSALADIDESWCRPPSGKLKIAFVADQFSPPVFDGSTYVYKNWIDFLCDRYELYAIFFDSYGGDAAAAERYLAERCAAHLILPGAPRSRWWKVLRAASRYATGAVFAPRWIEELGRATVHRTIAEFIARHDLRLFVINKLASVPLFGEANLRRRDATYFLDTHDDFVRRDSKDREVLSDLLARFPQLAAYPRFRDMQLRQRLSRLSLSRARAQEARLFALFDCLLSSSPGEDAFYSRSLEGVVPCVHIGWPSPQMRIPPKPAAGSGAGPTFDAGFIAGDYPFNVEGVLFFCSQILPLIRRHRPDFKILIAGHIAAPLSYLGCSWPGVEVCGYLPDTDAFYQRVRMIVVPLLSGTGASIKTLEALERGKPVVSTRVGARALDGRTGQHPRLFIADKAEEFAGKVLAVSTEDHDRGPPAAQAIAPAASPFHAAFEGLLRRYGRVGEPLLRCSE